jgi:hypothetical protein
MCEEWRFKCVDWQLPTFRVKMFRPSSELSSPSSMQHASDVLLVIHSRAAVGTAGISVLGAFAKLR